MASPSPPRGRSPARSATPTSARRVPSSHHSRSPTARRSPSPRSGSRSYSRSPPLRDGRNGHGRARSNGVSTSRSRSPSRGDRRSYRDRSYTRSPSRESRRAQSSKIVVEKLTKNVTEAHLREIFGSYGRIESIDLPLNKQCMYNADLEMARLKLTSNSHDKSRYSLYSLRSSNWIRSCNSTHARSTVGWHGHLGQHCSTPSCLFSISSTSPVLKTSSTTSELQTSSTGTTWCTISQPTTKKRRLWRR